MAVQTPLFSRQQPGGVFSIVDVPAHPGNVWFVDSGAATASDSAGSGQAPDAPFATLDYAVGIATASNGDTIYCMPGHAETKSVSGSLFALDVIGINVIGLGEGTLRPTFTFSHTGAATTISAASITVENVLFVCGIDSVTAPLTISAADVTLRNVEIRDAANVEVVVGVITTNAADRLHIDGLQYRGDVAGNACVEGVRLAGCDDVLIEDCIFDGVASTAFVNFSVAVDNVHVRDCVFNNVGTALTKDIVDTATGSTWDAISCWDLVGGYAFSGGSGAALATEDVSGLAASISVIDEYHDVPGADNTLNAQINEVIGNKTDAGATGAVTSTDTLVGYTKQLVTELAVIDEYHDVPGADNTLNAQINEVIGNKTDASAAGAVTATDTLVGYIKQLINVGLGIEQVATFVQTTPSGGTDTLFTITGGPIHVKKMIGVVTTVLANASNGTLQATTTEPAGTVALSTTVAIDNDAAGTSYRFAGATGVLTPDTNGAKIIDPVTVADCEWLVPIGNINFLTSGAMTGVITWYMSYIPLSPLSIVS